MAEPRYDVSGREAAADEMSTLRKRVADLEVQVRRLEGTTTEALQALANFSLLEDRHPTHRDSKYRDDPKATKHEDLERLLGTSGGMETAIYMLGTYCFDLSRRFAFVHTAVTKVLPPGAKPDDELRKERDQDDDNLHKPAGDDWKARSQEAAKQLRKWHDKVNMMLRDRGVL